jgi:hypothetical protein
MNMLKQLLKEAGIKIANLDARVRELGYDPDNLSDNDTLALVELLKGSSLAPTSSQTNLDSPSMDALIVDKVRELDKLKTTYSRVATKVADAKAAEIVAIVNSIPDLTYSRVTQMLKDSPDVNTFRQSAEELETALLRSFGVM